MKPKRENIKRLDAETSVLLVDLGTLKLTFTFWNILYYLWFPLAYILTRGHGAYIHPVLSVPLTLHHP